MTITTEERITRFKEGDTVQVADHAEHDEGRVGTVTRVKIKPDRETTYTVNLQAGRDSEKFVESDLEPDDSGFLDTDDLAQVLRELRAVAGDGGTYGLNSPDRHHRLITLGRITALAGRATWLEAADADREEMAAKYATPTAAK